VIISRSQAYGDAEGWTIREFLKSFGAPVLLLGLGVCVVLSVMLAADNIKVALTPASGSGSGGLHLSFDPRLGADLGFVLLQLPVTLAGLVAGGLGLALKRFRRAFVCGMLLLLGSLTVTWLVLFG
jgi:hypothetical protein